MVHLTKAQLHPHCPLYLPHVLCRDPTNAADEPHFTHGGELICHRLALLALEDDQGLARVQAAYVTREWNDLHTIQILIGRVITQNDRWTLFANFPTHRRSKVTHQTSPRSIADITGGTKEHEHGTERLCLQAIREESGSWAGDEVVLSLVPGACRRTGPGFLQAPTRVASFLVAAEHGRSRLFPRYPASPTPPGR